MLYKKRVGRDVTQLISIPLVITPNFNNVKELESLTWRIQCGKFHSQVMLGKTRCFYITNQTEFSKETVERKYKINPHTRELQTLREGTAPQVAQW